MDDKSQLRALLNGAQRQEYDEIFNRLAHSELSEREVEALRTSPDPEVRRLYGLFRPFDASTQQRFEQAVARSLAGQIVHNRPSARDLQLEPGIRPPKQRLRQYVQVAVPIAIAACLAIVFRFSHRNPASPLEIHPMNSPFESPSSRGPLLGSETARQERTALPFGACWELQLGVQRAAKLPEKTRAYFVRGHVVEPWSVRFEPLQNGRLKMQGGCAKLPGLTPGPWELVVLSGATIPDLPPGDIVSACRQAQSPSAVWRCDRHPIDVIPPPNASP